MLAGIVEAKVELPRAFRTEVLVAYFVAQRALVLAVAAKLAQVGSAESSCHIGADAGLGRDVIDGSHAARDSREVPAELLETLLAVFVEGVAVQMTGIEPDAAAQVQTLYEVL